MVSNLELRDLFQALSTSLRRVISHDSASLMLPDAQIPDMLRIYALDFPEGRGFLQQDMLVSISDSNPGKAFPNRAAHAGGQRSRTTCPSPIRTECVMAEVEGLRSSMVLPLVLNGIGTSVGVLTLGSRTESCLHPVTISISSGRWRSRLPSA